jgi:hypothetical protein
VRSDERELAVDTLARVREDGELVAERRFAERFARDLL